MSDDGWTIPALKQHYDARFDAMEKAVSVADAANEKRLDSVNEFRAVLETQQTTFVTKESVRWSFTALILGLGVATAIYASIHGVSP